MTDDTADDTAAEAGAPSPRRPQFRRFVAKVRMSPDESRRQSSVVQVAWKSFGERDRAMAFLNTHDEELAGKPLEIAMESDDGLIAVEQVLARRTAG